MGDIKQFFKIWGLSMVICLLDVVMVCALCCCIISAVANPCIGIIGAIGSLICIIIISIFAYLEIDSTLSLLEQHDTTDNRG